MTTISNNIIIEEMKFFAYHGVLPQENIVGSVYKVSLNIKTDFTKAAISDNLEYTISYADIYDMTKEEMGQKSMLLENVAYRICNRLFCCFESIEEINITIYKENPPMGADCKNVGVNAVYRK